MTRALAKLRLLAVTLVFAWHGSAGAYELGLVPSSGSYPLGSPFTIDVVMSGLETDGQILSVYDLTIGFDASILKLTSAQSAGALGAGSDFQTLAGVGSMNLFELSVLDDAALAAIQDDLFTIARLSFLGIDLGTSTIAFTDPDALVLGGTQVGDPPQTFNLLSLTHTVTPAAATIVARAVPEPGTLLLLGLALLLLASRLARPRR